MSGLAVSGGPGEGAVWGTLAGLNHAKRALEREREVAEVAVGLLSGLAGVDYAEAGDDMETVAYDAFLYAEAFVELRALRRAAAEGLVAEAQARHEQALRGQA